MKVVPAYPRGKLREDVGDTAAPLNQKLLAGEYVLVFLRLIIAKPFLSLKVFCFLFSSPRKLLKNMAVFLRAFYVADHILKNPARHIHAHWGGVSSTFAMIVSTLTHTQWSFTCHRWDIYDNNMLSKKSMHASFVRFISERGMNDAIRLGVNSDKALVIHMGVKLYPGAPSERSLIRPAKIFCVANLVPVKGHFYLISAAKKLIELGLEFELNICGDGRLRDALIDQVRESNIDDYVVFRGNLPHSDIMNIYQKGECALLVLPSIEMTSELHEGVPVSLMEAMAFGIPVISTNTGSINELLPVSLGLTVKDKDSSALANAIFELLNNDDLYLSKSIDVGKIIVSDWTISNSIDEMTRNIFNGKLN